MHLRKVQQVVANQFDQMAGLFVQYRAIYSNENLPKCTQDLTREVHSFATYLINLPKMAKSVFDLVKGKTNF